MLYVQEGVKLHFISYSQKKKDASYNFVTLAKLLGKEHLLELKMTIVTEDIMILH